MAIERPVKLFDFGAVQVAPAYEIDRQFDNHRRSIDAILKQIAKLELSLGDLTNSVAAARSPAARSAVGELGPNVGGPWAGDDDGAAATAQDYSQVCIDWAEHMPDTIPPNTLAVNAITGDHWSSRWWANQSANAFGMLAWWYQGAWPHPGPPSTPNTATGQPLPPGSMYFDTTLGVMMVWNGSAWVNLATPEKSVTASLYYLATGGQTAFPLSVPDRNGRTFTFNQTTPEGVQVYVNGVRLEPTYDFTIDTAGSTVTFLRGLTVNSVAGFDVLTPGAPTTLPPANMQVSASQTANNPGTYGVITPGVTLTLPNWGGWWTGGSWKVKDLTGVANPNITVVATGGTIDGKASVTLLHAYESLTFDPFLGGDTWTIS